MVRTLITGATGFLGGHIVERLVERGDDVLATVRPGSRRDRIELLERLGVRLTTADICDRQSIRAAMRGVERVFHVAGLTSLTLPRGHIYAVNVEGTRIVLEEALRAGVERVVYTSSAATIGPAPLGLTTDESNLWHSPGIPYIDAKREAENVALRLFARGLPVVIVNPASCLGAGDPGRSSTVLVRRFLRRQIPAYVNGTLNIVGVEDVADAHLLADRIGELGERYILGNRNFTMARLFADLGRLSGVEPPAVRLSTPAALALSALATRVPGAPRLPSANEIRASSLNWAFSSAKAKRDLRWTTSPHEDCLEATVAWYRERDGQSVGLPGARQALPLRVTGSLLRRLPL